MTLPLFVCVCVCEREREDSLAKKYRVQAALAIRGFDYSYFSIGNMVWYLLLCFKINFKIPFKND